ncbi:DUF5060 domain-containing protein [Pontibacter korlensis]|nr:DUF5060 domain-containing protein [Pontibacter korlensis]
MKFDKSFTSGKNYDNPLYDVNEFKVHLTSPSGRKKMVNAFWDGGTTWRFRFAPDELGDWSYTLFALMKKIKGCIRYRAPLPVFRTKANSKFILREASRVLKLLIILHMQMALPSSTQPVRPGMALSNLLTKNGELTCSTG